MKEDFNLVVTSADIDHVLAETVPDEAQRVTIREAFSQLHQAKQAQALVPFADIDYGLVHFVVRRTRSCAEDMQREIDEDAQLQTIDFVQKVMQRFTDENPLPADRYEMMDVLVTRGLHIYFEGKDTHRDKEQIAAGLDLAAKDLFDSDGKYVGPVPEPVPTFWQEVKSELKRMLRRQPA